MDVLSYVFRDKFLARLKRAYRRDKLVFGDSIAELLDKKGFLAFVNSLARQKWVVFAKPAFGGPTQVIRYLDRYTPRVAISNHRLLAFDGPECYVPLEGLRAWQQAAQNDPLRA